MSGYPKISKSGIRRGVDDHGDQWSVSGQEGTASVYLILDETDDDALKSVCHSYSPDGARDLGRALIRLADELTHKATT